MPVFSPPTRLNPINRLWNAAGFPKRPNVWPFSQIIVDRYSPEAHFNDLYEAIRWKNRHMPNLYATVLFGEGEWDLPSNTKLLNLGLIGRGRTLSSIVTGGNLWVYRPTFPVVLADFAITANGAGTNTAALFFEGTVSTEPVYCYNVDATASGGSSETYGVWCYNGGVVELHNCAASAFSGGDEYGVLVGVGATCRIYGGGQYYGDVAPAFTSGTLQLRDLPEIDSANIIVGVGGSLSAPSHLANWNVYSATIREKLTADRDYYVRTDGSDSNKGTSNSSGSAFLTIQKAIDVTAALDLNGYTITIHTADGTYSISTAISTRAFVGGGTIAIVGNTSTPANVLIQATSPIALLAMSHGPCKYSLNGFKLTTNQGTGCIGILMNNQSKLNASNIDFGPMSSSSNAGQHINLDEQSVLTWDTGYTVSGRFDRHFNIAGMSLMTCTSKTITISPSASFSGGTWAYMYGMSNCDYYSLTFSGSLTTGAQRFNVSYNSTLRSGGTTLPGSVAGTTGNGGVSDST